MKLRNRLLAGAGSLALLGSVVVAAAPAAHASPTPVGSCTGGVFLAVATPALTSASVNTVLPVKPAQDITVSPRKKLTGSCTFGATTGAPSNMIARLSGFASCNRNTAPAGGPLFGKLAVTGVGPSVQQGYVSVLGIGKGSNYGDVADISGIMTKGATPGAQITGSLWIDAASKLARADALWPGFANSGYEPDVVSQSSCESGSGSVSTVLIGDGVSPFETAIGPLICASAPCKSATGLSFTWGE